TEAEASLQSPHVLPTGSEHDAEQTAYPSPSASGHAGSAHAGSAASVSPLQSSSMPLPHTSVAPGWTDDFVSSQSVEFATYPAGAETAWLVEPASPLPSPSASR